jgi:hypothetical protein
MHDKFLTNGSGEEPNGSRKKGAPHCVVRHHSVTVPIYAGLVACKTRYTISFYRDGKRTRRSYTDLEKAKKEAKLIAEKILRGMQGHNDLKPAEREPPKRQGDLRSAHMDRASCQLAQAPWRLHARLPGPSTLRFQIHS